jgi:hypothetical protein
MNKRVLFSSLTMLMATAIIYFSGCTGSQNKEKSANEAAADSIKKELTLSPETQSMLYEFPTPFEVTGMLGQAKAGYIFDMTNPAENVSKYVTEKSKALNLGVYSSDLAYSATYNMVDETNGFLGCTGKLADELGIAGVYESNLVERVKSFGDNKDSLVALVSNVFQSTNDFLEKNNRTQVAVLAATGGFVEGIYLAAALNMVARDNTQISTVIANQRETYGKLMTILDVYSQDEQMKPLYENMAKLKAVFTDYGLEPGKALPQESAVAINDLTEFVRNEMIK